MDTIMVNGPEDEVPGLGCCGLAAGRGATYGGYGSGSSRRAQAGDLKKVRNLQKLTAPRGALLYPRLSREEFEGRFLGLMPYLELKGEGNHSMAGN